MNFLKIIHKVFGDVILSNMENVLQRNLRSDRARECIFRASGGTNFENFTAQCQPWCHLPGFNVCTALPKKTLDTSMQIKKPKQSLFILFLRK